MYPPVRELAITGTVTRFVSILSVSRSPVGSACLEVSCCLEVSGCGGGEGFGVAFGPRDWAETNDARRRQIKIETKSVLILMTPPLQPTSSLKHRAWMGRSYAHSKPATENMPVVVTQTFGCVAS